MELDEFIAEATASIARGIIKGQQSEVGEYIAPLLQGQKRNDYGNFHLKNDSKNQATIVQFEVSVTTKKETKEDLNPSLKAKLFVVDAELGGQKGKINHEAQLHRLKFAIPVTIPKSK